MTSQNVEVKLELGHRAIIRSETTAEGFTHDWTLFVRGPEGCHIQHYVEKVVFFLHESFPKPKRVLKEPPYHVSESGYAGFNLAIEVHFRNKEDPKKVHFDYDLYLHLEGPPIHNFRLEKLTFQNPNPEFRKKLLKGGGVAISGGSQNSINSNSNPVHTETEQAPKSKSIRGSNEGPKKTPKVKLPHAAKEVPAKVPEPSHHPFTHIFGAPIKTKPSPDTSHKSKETTKEKHSSNSSNSNKTTSTPTTVSSSSSSSSSVPNNNAKSTSKDSHKTSFSNKEKVSKGVCKETEKKETKTNNENKSSTHKRSSSPSSQGHKESSSIKKRKRSTSTSSTTSSLAEKSTSGQVEKSATSSSAEKSAPSVPEKSATSSLSEKSTTSLPEKNNYSKEKKAKSKDAKKEHKTVTPPAVVAPAKKESSQKQTKPAQVVPRKEQRELKSPVCSTHNNNNDQGSVASSGRARLESESSDSSSSSHEDKDVKPEEGESRSSVGTASSPSSSLTLSSITPGSAHGPLATMMAQMEQELVSPLSSDQASPAHSVASPEPEETPPSPPNSPPTPPTPVKVEEPEPVSKKVKDKRQNEKHMSSSKKTKDEVDNCLPPPLPSQLKADGKQQPIDAAYLHELMQLQEQIMALRDKQHLQRIVDVIEETGLYQITSSTIDFDLCALDRSTVQKLQNCMAVT